MTQVSNDNETSTIDQEEKTSDVDATKNGPSNTPRSKRWADRTEGDDMEWFKGMNFPSVTRPVGTISTQDSSGQATQTNASLPGSEYPQDSQSTNQHKDVTAAQRKAVYEGPHVPQSAFESDSDSDSDNEKEDRQSPDASEERRLREWASRVGFKNENLVVRTIKKGEGTYQRYKHGLVKRDAERREEMGIRRKNYSEVQRTYSLLSISILPGDAEENQDLPLSPVLTSPSELSTSPVSPIDQSLFQGFDDAHYVEQPDQSVKPEDFEETRTTRNSSNRSLPISGSAETHDEDSNTEPQVSSNVSENLDFSDFPERHVSFERRRSYVRSELEATFNRDWNRARLIDKLWREGRPLEKIEGIQDQEDPYFRHIYNYYQAKLKCERKAVKQQRKDIENLQQVLEAAYEKLDVKDVGKTHAVTQVGAGVLENADADESPTFSWTAEHRSRLVNCLTSHLCGECNANITELQIEACLAATCTFSGFCEALLYAGVKFKPDRLAEALAHAGLLTENEMQNVQRVGRVGGIEGGKVGELRQENRRLQREMQEQSDKLQELKEAYEAELIEKQSGVLKAHELLQKQLDELQKHNETQQKLIDSLRQELRAVQSKRRLEEQQKEGIEVLQQEPEAAYEKLDMKDAETQRRVEELKKAAKDAETATAAANKKISAFLDELNDCEARNTQLVKRLSVVDQKLAEANKRNRRLEADNTELRKRCGSPEAAAAASRPPLGVPFDQAARHRYGIRDDQERRDVIAAIRARQAAEKKADEEAWMRKRVDWYAR